VFEWFAGRRKPMPARTLLFHFLRSVALILCLAALAHAQKKQITVAAASDLQTAMPEIAETFGAESSTHVELIFGSSGNFFAQIQNGAPFDLFFSADSEFPSKLVQSGRAEPQSAVTYAVGSLVLWVPANSKCDPQTEKWNCLLKPEISKIAIANPAHAPYGRAAVQALQSARLYEHVRPKLVFGENISQAAQFAQSGSAQEGLLSYSQAQSAVMRNGKQWEIPQGSYPPIEQSVVILKNARDKSAAQAFVQFVTEGRGRGILQRAGFHLPDNTRQPTRHK
jgi:molybdate transport system substrate-binding protein